ncbi:hypothetical protein EVAR_82312_1 [Eumeta japonica]|uniref:Uncharacterized protein n=1 Tax=Eumeta variegata TaxID=151549 RepID=A0A4C1W048_EUMVA|nr:hypothetical protein EVAR_82312_1 [Eumeta japonica]
MTAGRCRQEAMVQRALRGAGRVLKYSLQNNRTGAARDGARRPASAGDVSRDVRQRLSSGRCKSKRDSRLNPPSGALFARHEHALTLINRVEIVGWPRSLETILVRSQRPILRIVQREAALCSGFIMSPVCSTVRSQLPLAAGARGGDNFDKQTGRKPLTACARFIRLITNLSLCGPAPAARRPSPAARRPPQRARRGPTHC